MSKSSQDARAVRSEDATLTLHRLLFQPLESIASEQLYVSLPRGRVVQLARESITLAAFSTASTRTYFGRFPAAYYQRWTSVRTVIARANVTGSGRIRAYASDDLDRERIVGVADIDSVDREVEVEIELALDRFLDGGFLWVDLESGEGELTVSDLRFEAIDPVVAKPVSIVVCTHNRAPDCASTLSSLASDEQVLNRIERVVVVDQGTQRVDALPEFPSIAESLGGRLAYLTQRNLGGAGGFTRGMYELTEEEADRSADIILMDDDIVLEPETLLRLSAFSSRTIQPVIVGAQMLYLYHPNLLHTSAEDAQLDTLRAGVPVHEDEQGIDLTEELPYRWAEGGYNAWWTCLIPTSVIRKIGYPLPLFFQWDDIEYGLRARTADYPTVTLPGSAVWHADFALKDRDDWSRYFSYRNSLIVAALHGDWRTRKVVATLARDLREMILSMQYGLAATTLAAIDGFLAGPESIRAGSAEPVEAVRLLRGGFPDTVRHRPEEILESGLFSLPAIHSGGYPRIPWLVVIKRTAWQVLGLNRLIGKISSADSNWYHSSQFRQAIVTDAALDTFRIRRFDAKTALRVTRQSVRTLGRLARRGRAVAREWHGSQESLSSRDTWSRIFHRDEQEDR